jgi:ferric-dicitrate binding protein FerR (iron transport regulator)
MENIYEILEKHFQQLTSGKEEEKVLKFKKENSSEYLMLQQLWHSHAKIEVTDFDSQKIWPQVLKAAQERKSNLSLIYSRFRQVAAVALIVIAGSLFAYFMLQKHDKTPALMATATTSAQTDSVLLADGSTVWLNRNSSLHYPGTFDGKTRKVKLEGEAFFEVAKNPKQPFVIETKHSEVKVLGTSFSINTNTLNTSVYVSTGKVRVKSAHSNSQADLLPNEMAMVSVKGLQKSKITNPNYLSWKTGVFVFDDTPLTEAIKELNRYYQKPIVLKTDKTNLLFSARFDKDKQENIIEIINLTFNLSSYENTDFYELR